jgi:hypothetical protein
MDALQQYSGMLRDRELSCIILKNDEVIFTSTFIGVKPLLMFMQEGTIIGENDTLTLVDKVIGKAALLLAVKSGIDRIYTPILSEEALAAADHYRIPVEAEKVVPYIVNRAGDGKCPIEQSVMDTLDLDDAYVNIKGAIAVLMKQKA